MRRKLFRAKIDTKSGVRSFPEPRGHMMSLQETPSRGGRRATKFSPANVQKIKDLVAQGFKREEIAEALEVTVGSLQVTCSRLGISLRIPKIFHCSGDGRRTPVLSRPNLPDHGQIRPELPRFQIVLARNGVMQHATDVPFMEPDIGRLGFEAAVQNLGITQFMAVVVTTAIKKDLIYEILRAPSHEPCSPDVIDPMRT
jgi:hypothetical protein